MEYGDINRIRKAVNRLDEEMVAGYGNPKYYRDPDMAFRLTCYQYQDYLAKVIAELNEVEIPKGMEVATFTKGMVLTSTLNWGSCAEYDVDSSMYRRRFLTLFLIQISDHVMDLCEREFQYRSPGVGIYEHGYFYLQDMQKKISQFIQAFLTGNAWRELILDMLEYSILLDVKKRRKQEAMIDGAKQLIYDIRKGYEKKLFVKPLLPENLIIQNIFLLVALLCHGTGEINKVPKFQSYEHKKAGKDDYRYQIAFLGKGILTSPDHTKGCIMQDIFEDARPDLRYNFKNLDHDPYLEMGCRGLDFVDFIINDKRVHKLIDKLLWRSGYWF